MAKTPKRVCDTAEKNTWAEFKASDCEAIMPIIKKTMGIIIDNPSEVTTEMVKRTFERPFCPHCATEIYSLKRGRAPTKKREKAITEMIQNGLTEEQAEIACKVMF